MPQDSKGRYSPANESSSAGSVASAAKTATTTLTAFSTVDVENINATLVITAASGTNPTLDLTLETTADGTNYYTVGTFAQQTTTQAGLARIFGPLGATSRWKFTVGGTTPSFTCAITTTFDRDT
jgi:hypothetical protein